jgi:hypothetical protein
VFPVGYELGSFIPKDVIFITDSQNCVLSIFPEGYGSVLSFPEVISLIKLVCQQN